MAKFCFRCGSPVGEGDRVCGNCGAPLVTHASESVKAGNRKLILFGAGVFFLVVVIVIVVNVIGNFVGYKGTVRKMVKALQEYDMETLESLASSVSNELYAYDGYDEDKDLYEIYEDEVSDVLDDYEEHVRKIEKIKFKIFSADTISDRRVEKFEDELVDEYNMDVSGIKKIMGLELTLTVKGSKKSASYNVDDLYLIKESGGWKLLYEEIY